MKQSGFPESFLIWTVGSHAPSLHKFVSKAWDIIQSGLRNNPGLSSGNSHSWLARHTFQCTDIVLSLNIPARRNIKRCAKYAKIYVFVGDMV